MQIYNVRLGLACNSSSTHSLVFIPASKRGDYVDEGAENNEYGWENFVVASREAKSRYLSILLYSNLLEVVDSGVAAIVASAIAGLSSKRGVGPEGYIDHQSVMSLPKSWTGNGLDLDFANDLREYLLRDDLLILGGNDNDDTGHPLGDLPEGNIPLPRDEGRTQLVARWDKEYKYWSIFNRQTGAKIRMSFDPNAKPPTCSSVPELIDLKITDWCPYGCPFCYQDSTLAGKHANREVVESIIETLGHHKVFEVAIGGGEPTLHPHFVQILEWCRANGVVPNFTTKNLGWLRNPRQWAPIWVSMGSFAYSVTSVGDVTELWAQLISNGLDKDDVLDRVSVQYIMGSTSIYDLRDVLSAAWKCGFHITLLGYKTTGRGSTYKPEDYSGWLGAVQATVDESGRRHGLVGIDTALAHEYANQLERSGVKDIFFHIKEGEYSMYIDAVTQRVAPSSYCSEDLYSKANEAGARYVDWGQMILGAYRGWHPVQNKAKLLMGDADQDGS